MTMTERTPLIHWPTVLLVLLVHLPVSMLVFGIAHGLAAGRGVPPAVDLLWRTVGAPVFLAPDVVLDRIGDHVGDTALFLFFALNSLMWGVAISLVTCLTRRRRLRGRAA
jgi:hypothetical protein